MNNNKKEVIAYFANGRSTKFDADKVTICREMPEPEALAAMVQKGLAVVNWENVCYLREWMEPEDIDP